jgi:hypothetical protein
VRRPATGGGSRYGLVVAQSDPDLNPRTKAVHHGHETIDGKSPEIGVANSGEIGGRNSGSTMGFAHTQAVAIEELDDFRSKPRFELFGIGVFALEITKHVTASVHYPQLIALHNSVSFSLFNRSRINSKSRCAVLMPCVDCFWKACITQTASESCTA